MAAFWVIMAVIILTVWPSADENDSLGLTREKRVWMGAFTMMLVGYNMVRWRLARVRQRSDEQARALQDVIRSRRRHDEPRNPDFDFGDQDDAGGQRPPESRGT
jgi:hypothetical protein